MRLAREILRRHGAGDDVRAPSRRSWCLSDFCRSSTSAAGKESCSATCQSELGRASIPRRRWWLARLPARSWGQADALPFATASFGAAALLYVLYHLDDPGRALAEARRVVRVGGLVVAAAPSRRDSPELAFGLPDRSLTFDAELAPGLMAEHLTAIEVTSSARAPRPRAPPTPHARLESRSQ